MTYLLRQKFKRWYKHKAPWQTFYHSLMLCFPLQQGHNITRLYLPSFFTLGITCDLLCQWVSRSDVVSFQVKPFNFQFSTLSSPHPYQDYHGSLCCCGGNNVEPSQGVQIPHRVAKMCRGFSDKEVNCCLSPWNVGLFITAA